MQILYVEDDPRDADLTRRQLRKTAPHFDLELVSTQREALARLSGPDVSRYDLVLTDMRLHDGDGLAILSHIRARELPLAVVLITGAGDEEIAVAVLKAGANDYIVKRGDYLARLPLTLEDALNHYHAEAARRARPLRMLYAENNATDIDLLKRHLAAHASHIHMDAVNTAVETLQRLPERGHVSDYDILLLDYRLPGLNALEMLKDLYQVRSLDIPVVLVTGKGDEEVALQALKLGAFDYVPKNPGYLYQLPSVLENAFHRAQLARGQAALQESEERFRRLAENAQDLIFRYSFIPSQGFEYVSPAAAAISGFSPEEFYANPDLFFELSHPDDQQMLEARTPSDTPTGKPLTLRWIRKDRKVIWTEQHNVPVYDETGNLVAIEGIVRDITERKRAEEELRQSEAQRSNAMNIAKLGYWEYDVAENLFTFNDHFYAIFRTSAEQVGGYKLSPARYAELFVYPEDRSVVAAEIKKSLETTDPDYSRQLEHRITYADGEIGYISVRHFVVKDKQGRTIKTFGANQDITERKQAEKALRESENKYRTLVENIPQKIFTKNSDSIYMSCNENFARDLGIKPDQVAGRTDYDFFPSELADKYRADDKRIMETGKAEDLEEKYIQSGEEIWVSTIKTPIRQEDGTVAGILGVFWDITKRKQTEEEKEKLQAQLIQAQKLEAVGQLAGGVAHDFNNMLSVILGYTDLALDQLDPSQPLFSDLKEIRKASMRSTSLTRQLLAFARKQTIIPSVLDLNETVEGMLKMLQRLIGEDINLVWKPGEALWSVKVDPSQIDQILANLCVNARDAIAGVGKIIIETHKVILNETDRINQPELVPGEYVLLTLSDDGCGMDQETQARMFEPFFTTKGVGEGTGLGLATVYGIVKQNNGFIFANSEPGRGTSFKIYLPRHVIKTEQMREESTTAQSVRGHETILIVEDEPAILDIEKRVLEKYGYQILVASTPGEAIRIAKKHTGDIHILITDVVLPEMNGRELEQKLISLIPGLKCLFMSGYSGNVIARYGVLDEGVNFIQKPFSMQSLAAKVREVLNNKLDAV